MALTVGGLLAVIKNFSYFTVWGIIFTFLRPLAIILRLNQELKNSCKRLNENAAKNLNCDAQSVFVKLPKNKICLHAVEAGPRSGKLVVLLHGFPDIWHSWSKLIPALAKKGYFVVAPDMRGYNLSDKPKNVSDYRLPALTSDVADLIDYYNRKTAVVIAHDWGGVVAWAFAERYPEKLEKLVIMNAPHPLVYRKVIKKDPAQGLSSWYILFFQIPFLPVNVLTFFPHHTVKTFFKTKRKDALNDVDRELLASNFVQDGAAAAMINYYKALFRTGLFGPRPKREKREGDGKINAPTLVLWGQNDVALLPECAQAGEYVRNLQIVYIPNCSHWVPYEAPELIEREVLKFIKEDGLVGKL